MSNDLEFFKWINGNNNEVKNNIISDINFNTYYLGDTTSQSININNIIYERNNILSSLVSLALYLVKFDICGNVLWFKWIESTSNLSNLVITIYANKMIYISANISNANSTIVYNDIIVANNTYAYNTFIMNINCNNGSNKWTRILKSNLGNYIYSMLTDNLGILYIFGNASANNPLSMSFNTNTYSKSGGQDVFLLKINNDVTNSNKSIKWISGTGYENGYGIALDKFKNIFLVIHGTNITNLIIDNIQYNNLAAIDNTTRIFLIKLNNNANNSLSWIKKIDGSGNDFFSDIKIDMSNNILLTGYTYSTNLSIDNIIYKNRPITNSLEGVYIIKFDNNGNTNNNNFLWIDGMYTDISFKLLVDNENNYYFTGRTTSTNLFIDNNNYTTIPDYFIIKFDSNFQILWIENITGLGASNILNIICNNKNEIYLSGSTNKQTIRFKNVNYTQTNTDNSSFFIKLKSNLKSDIEINMVTLNNVDFLLDFEVPNMANLFPITYLQDNINTDLFTIDVSMNQILIHEYLSNSINPNWKTVKSNNVITNGISGIGNLPYSLLEIIALRVFGSGKARAAIINDNLIENSVLSEKNNFFNALTNKRFELFKRYQQSDRFDANSAFAPVQMNLSSTRLSFPIWLCGSLMNENGNILKTSSYSNGYSSYNGLGKMSNGVYNIPVVIRFFQK